MPPHLKTTLVTLLLVGLVGCSSDSSNSGGDDAGSGGVDAPPLSNTGVTTLSGAGDPGYVDGSREVARFANPVSVTFGPDGKAYVADFDNGKIRVVDPADGQTRTLIAQETFRRPFALAFAADGTLYVTTDKNTTSNEQGPMTGTIWRVDNGVATVVAQNIGRPRGIAVLPDGRLAISDYQHHVIRLVNPTTGAVTPLAGTWDAKGFIDGAGAAARFSAPYGMAILDGKLVVADSENHRLRLVALDGSVETLAGSGAAGFADGATATAKFSNVQGVAVAANRDIYIADPGNFRVRRIRADTVETIAGSGEGGYLDSEDRLAAQFFGLEGIGVTPDGSLVFVADGGRGEDVPYNRIRRVNMN